MPRPTSASTMMVAASGARRISVHIRPNALGELAAVSSATLMRSSLLVTLLVDLLLDVRNWRSLANRGWLVVRRLADGGGEVVGVADDVLRHRIVGVAQLHGD